jgi:IS30 family transposase
MAKKGRPRIEINWADVEKLCFIHATEGEVASYLGCSPDTVARAIKRKFKMTFAEYSAQKAGPGKISLRRAQWDLALKGNKTMLIWLGKQHLGQTDKVTQTNLTGSVSEQLASMSPEQKEAEIDALEKLLTKP